MIIAVDTETEDLTPWSVQWSVEPGQARMVLTDGIEEHQPSLKRALEHPDNLTVVHNALFDAKVLWQVGIRPARIADTMVMAYILGYGAIGLKVLAYRLLGIDMSSYRAVTAPASSRKALAYLTRVVDRTWPAPDPVWEWKPDGTPHLKQPQNIATKVKRLLKKHAADPGIDLREKWTDMEYTEQVEDELGPMEYGYLSEIDPDTAIAYACLDADVTGRLYPILWRQVRDAGLEEVFWIDMGAVEMVTEMTTAGILIDKGHMARLTDEFDTLCWQHGEAIDKAAGRHVNPNSSQQVGDLLYAMGVHRQRGLSTDARHLDELAPRYPIVDHIQTYRQFAKLIGTYTAKLPRCTDPAGRIHTRYSMTRTATARLASSDPNLQNIPARTIQGKRVREGFVAAPGKTLLALDYSQIEMRLAAMVSGDEAMLTVYRTGGDIHESTRYALFGGPPDELQRKYAKVVNFSTIYLVTAQGLLTAMHHAGIHAVTEADCARFIRNFFHLYQGYADWVERVKAEARRNGCVVNALGRRKWVPEVESTQVKVKEDGLRAAVNFPIQSLAGDIMKLAMAALTVECKGLRDAGVSVTPLLQVHDELVFEVDADMAATVGAHFAHVMEHVYPALMPKPVDVETGPNWGVLN